MSEYYSLPCYPFKLIKQNQQFQSESFKLGFQKQESAIELLKDHHCQQYFEVMQSLWSDYFKPFIENIGAKWQLPSQVTFFAGSFSPWHQGHQNCLELYQKHISIPLVLAPDCNPQKSQMSIDPVKLRQLSLQNPTLPLYPGFYLNQKANPSAQWLTELKQRRPDLKIHWLTGFDQLANLTHWQAAEKLPTLIEKLYWVSRLENNEQRQDALSKAQQLGFQTDQLIHLGHHAHEELSSSQLRTT